VEKFKTLEHLKAQVTVVRWHLDAATLGNGEKKRRHLDSAALTHQGALELLAQLALPNDERAAMTKQLAELSEQLRAAGQPEHDHGRHGEDEERRRVAEEDLGLG
jgi:transposase